MRPLAAVCALLALPLACAGSARAADQTTFELTLQDHRFSPADMVVPANTRLKFMVKNLDKTAAEFESDDFKAEKVVPAGQEVAVTIPALKPGTYEFHDEYHEAASKTHLTAQ